MPRRSTSALCSQPPPEHVGSPWRSSMTRCRNPLILSLMIALPHLAVSADAPPPILDLTISNGTRLIQHFHDSIYFKVWSSPSLAAVRAKLDEIKPQAQEQVGFDPFAVLEGLASARLRVSWEAVPGVPPAESPPEILLQLDLGPQAMVLFHGLIDKLPLPATTV